MNPSPKQLWLPGCLEFVKAELAKLDTGQRFILCLLLEMQRQGMNYE